MNPLRHCLLLLPLAAVLVAAVLVAGGGCRVLGLDATVPCDDDRDCPDAGRCEVGFCVIDGGEGEGEAPRRLGGLRIVTGGSAAMPTTLGTLPGVLLADGSTCVACVARQPRPGVVTARTVDARLGPVTLGARTAVELIVRAPTGAEALEFSVGSGSDALVVQLSSEAGRVLLGQETCGVGPLFPGAWHHLLCVAGGQEASCVLDGDFVCDRGQGPGPLGDGGDVDFVAGSGALAVARVWSGRGAIPADLDVVAGTRLRAFLGIDGDIVATASGVSPGWLLLDTAFLVSPRWPRLAQPGAGTAVTLGLLIEPGATAVQEG